MFLNFIFAAIDFARGMAILVQQAAKMVEIYQKAKQVAQGLSEDKWKGADQQAFQAEMGGNILPAVQNVIDTANEFKNRIEKAKERMDQAEQQAKSLVQNLSQAFQAISGF